MAQKLYVGNLPFTVTEDDLRQVFAQHGEVSSVQIMMARDTGRPSGFAFVEREDGQAAIQALDGQEYGGSSLRVNVAREREAGGGGGGGGRGGFGGGRGGGGG